MDRFTLVTLLLLLFLLCPFTTAEIKKLRIATDSRPMILLEKFGFTHLGHVSVTVKEVTFSSTLSPPDPSRLGFFLLSDEALIQVMMESERNPNFCVLDSPYIQSLFTFKALDPPKFNSFNHSYPVTVPNEYSLFFANCAPECQVTMDVRTVKSI